jgi:hypothetical protein
MAAWFRHLLQQFGRCADYPHFKQARSVFWAILQICAADRPFSSAEVRYYCADDTYRILAGLFRWWRRVVPRAFGVLVSHLPSAILSLPAFVGRSPPDNSCMYPSWISRSLCSAGIVRCIKPLAQSRNETNSSWVNGADKSGFIFQVCASGALLFKPDSSATIKLTHYPYLREVARTRRRSTTFVLSVPVLHPAQRVAAQAHRAGVERLVHVSGIGADAASPFRYIRKRGEGELAVRAAFADALFVRPAVMFGPDDAFLTTILKLLRQLPIYPMFGRGRTRLQPAYVEDVAEAVARVMRRAETHSIIFEFGGPRVYSYEQFLRAVAHQAGLAPLLIPIPFAVWHALAWASEIFRSPLLTRDQVELMQIGTPCRRRRCLDLLNLRFRRTRSRQRSRRCCRIADERGSSVNPLPRMTGARATSACI